MAPHEDVNEFHIRFEEKIPLNAALNPKPYTQHPQTFLDVACRAASVVQEDPGPCLFSPDMRLGFRDWGASLVAVSLVEAVALQLLAVRSSGPM